MEYGFVHLLCFAVLQLSIFFSKTETIFVAELFEFRASNDVKLFSLSEERMCCVHFNVVEQFLQDYFSIDFTWHMARRRRWRRGMKHSALMFAIVIFSNYFSRRLVLCFVRFSTSWSRSLCNTIFELQRRQHRRQ